MAATLAISTASAARAQTSVEAQTSAAPPLVLLLDGLGVYVENNYIGVSSLARPLQSQGFRTLTDSHLMTRTGGVVPDIIIGHSMGGETALRYARKLTREGKPAPMVITIDAAPTPPACSVPRCTNIHGPGFANVRGAVNIDAWASGARFSTHAQLPTTPAVRGIILEQTQAFMNQRRKTASLTPAATTAEADRMRALSPQSPASAASTSRSTPQMWSVPGWTMPNWGSANASPNGG